MIQATDNLKINTQPNLFLHIHLIDWTRKKLFQQKKKKNRVIYHDYIKTTAASRVLDYTERYLYRYIDTICILTLYSKMRREKKREQQSAGHSVEIAGVILSTGVTILRRTCNASI